MNDKPLLSIIVPVFNGEKYLAQTISSLRVSEYSNCEILICDDASTDETWKIMQSFAADERVRLFRNDSNMGPGFTRNKLIEASHGDFVAIQDADDLFAPSRFREQVDFLMKNLGVDVVGSGAILRDPLGIDWGMINVESEPSYFLWIMQKSIVHATVMFRRWVGQSFRYNEDLRIGEDYYFLTKIYLSNVVIRNIPRNLYYYTVTKHDLRTRAISKFNELFKSKLIISKLFPVNIRWMFLLINMLLITLSLVRSASMIVTEKVTRSNRKQKNKKGEPDSM